MDSQIKKNLSRDSYSSGDIILALGISQIGYFALFISNIIIARLLGPEGKGAFSLYNVVISLIIAFSTLGIGHGQMYYASKNSEKIRYFMPNAAVVSIILGGGIASIYFAAGFKYHFKFVESLGGKIGVLTIIAIIVMIYGQFLRQYFLAANLFKLSKVLLTISQIIPLFFYFILFLLNKMTLVTVIYAFILSQVVGAIVFYYIGQRKNVCFWGKASLGYAKESIGFGIRQYLSDLVLYLANRVDFILVVFFVGKRGLGIYSISVALAEVILRLSSELGTILFPAFAANRISKARTQYLLKINIILSFIVAIIIMLLGKPMIRLFVGDMYLESVTVLYWLLPGLIAWTTIFITWNHISAGGKPEIGIPVFGGAAVVDIIVNLVLLPRIGVNGAGIASTVSYIFAAIIFMNIYCKREKLRIIDVLLFNRADLLFIRNRILIGIRHK
jgi:O-antigen/teichoic acid export membrane protein